jgi:hypothetical protein
VLGERPSTCVGDGEHDVDGVPLHGLCDVVDERPSIVLIRSWIDEAATAIPRNEAAGQTSPRTRGHENAPSTKAAHGRECVLVFTIQNENVHHTAERTCGFETS